MNTNKLDCAFPANENSTNGLSKYEYAVIAFVAAHLEGWVELPGDSSMERIARNATDMADVLFNHLNIQRADP